MPGSDVDLLLANAQIRTASLWTNVSLEIELFEPSASQQRKRGRELVCGALEFRSFEHAVFRPRKDPPD